MLGKTLVSKEDLEKKGAKFYLCGNENVAFIMERNELYLTDRSGFFYII